MSRTAIKNGGMPSNFNKAVLSLLSTKYSSAYVTMVHNGKRSNKEIREAITATEKMIWK